MLKMWPVVGTLDLARQPESVMKMSFIIINHLDLW